MTGACDRERSTKLPREVPTNIIQHVFAISVYIYILYDFISYITNIYIYNYIFIYTRPSLNSFQSLKKTLHSSAFSLRSEDPQRYLSSTCHERCSHENRVRHNISQIKGGGGTGKRKPEVLSFKTGSFVMNRDDGPLHEYLFHDSMTTTLCLCTRKQKGPSRRPWVAAKINGVAAERKYMEILYTVT